MDGKLISAKSSCIVCRNAWWAKTFYIIYYWIPKQSQGKNTRHSIDFRAKMKRRIEGQRRILCNFRLQNNYREIEWLFIFSDITRISYRLQIKRT